jgi:hypothetical protein
MVVINNLTGNRQTITYKHWEDFPNQDQFKIEEIDKLGELLYFKNNEWKSNGIYEESHARHLSGRNKLPRKFNLVSYKIIDGWKIVFDRPQSNSKKKINLLKYWIKFKKWYNKSDENLRWFWGIVIAIALAVLGIISKAESNKNKLPQEKEAIEKNQ